MKKISLLARGLALKNAQNIPPTLRSAPGPDMSGTFIPKAPKVPEIKYEDYSPKESGIELAHQPTERGESLDEEVTPTIRPEHREPFKQKALEAIDLLYFSNLTTPTFKNHVAEVIRAAKTEHDLTEVNKEMHQILNTAEHDLLNIFMKIKKIRAILK